jgi:hypothetical protein
MHHRLLVSGLKILHRSAVLLQGLAHASNISMPEYSEHTVEKSLSISVSFHVLAGHELNQCLSSCQSTCCHRELSMLLHSSLEASGQARPGCADTNRDLVRARSGFLDEFDRGDARRSIPLTTESIGPDRSSRTS